MKLLTINFLTCAVKSCKSSLSTTAVSRTEEPTADNQGPSSSSSSPFPLHFRDAVLERTEIPFNALFIRNILPRINWDALRTTATELGILELVPAQNPLDDPSSLSGFQGTTTKNSDGEVDDDGKTQMEVDAAVVEDQDQGEAVLRRLHSLLLETSVSEGKLVCGKCEFEYPIKEGVANFLLPAHLV